MKPKKHFIDRAIENGSIDRLNKLLSASHILLCVSNNYVEEAADLMKANGLLLGDLKKLHNNFLTAADRYFSEFATMVTDAKMDMFADIEAFDTIFRQWNKIEKEWEPKNIKQ